MKTPFVLAFAPLAMFAVSSVVSPSVSAQENVEEKADSVMLQKYHNFKYESLFESHSVDFRRCHHGETMLLGEVFRTLGLPSPVKAVACSKDKEGSTAVRKISGTEGFEGFDIFNSVNIKMEDGTIVSKKGENVILVFEFAPQEVYTSGIVFIRNTAGSFPKDFIRLSMILCPRVAKDDLRSFPGSEAAPLTGSFLLSFETGDASEYMEEFNSVMKSALSKYQAGEELTVLEYACLMGGFDSVEYASTSEFAEDAVQEGRYFDAVPKLEKCLDIIKYYGSVNEEDRARYADICADLAKCYSSLGETVLACRFYAVAAILDGSFSEEYAMSLASFGDIRAQGVDDQALAAAYSNAIDLQKASLGEYSGAMTMRDVVCAGLGIPECGIQSMTAFDMDGKVIMREDGCRETLDARLSPLLADGNTLVFDYDLAGDITHVDNSYLLNDNSVVVTVKEIPGEEGMFRLNYLVPNFIGDDSRRSMFSSNRPQSLSFVVSSVEDYTPDSIKGLFSHAIQIQDDGLYLQCLKALDYILASLKASDYDPSECDINFLVDLYCEIGFCLCELSLFDRALYYQEVASQSMTTDYVSEYINTLVSSHDILSLGEIERFKSAELQEGNITRHEFDVFLLRRKTYLLVELRRYDEAEAVLKELEKEPDQAGFVKSEREFIRSMMSE